MPKVTVTDEIKQEIIRVIKEENVSVLDASHKYHVHFKTIYAWLAKLGTSSGSPGKTNYVSLLRIKQLEKENQELVEIIGRMVHSQAKIKKKDK